MILDSIKKPYISGQIHTNLIQSDKILQIVFLEQHSIKIKKYQITNQDLSDQAKLFFKGIKNIGIYSKENPHWLKISNEDIPKLFFSYSIGKNIHLNQEICLSKQKSSQKPAVEKKTENQNQSSSHQCDFHYSKIKYLEKQLLQKQFQIQKLGKKIIQWENKYKVQDHEVQRYKIINKSFSEYSQKDQHKVDKPQLYEQKVTLNINGRPLNQKKFSITPSPCSSDRNSQQNQKIVSSKLVYEGYSPNLLQALEVRRSRKMSTPGQKNSFLSVSTPIRMKLLINPFQINQLFTVKQSKGLNKIIQKIKGQNLGHQIAFENWIYKEGSSYFRFRNQGIKNSFLFVGIVLQNRKKDRLSYHSDQCISYNCSNGYIWSGGLSHKNPIVGKQFKQGELMTVLINSNQKSIQWYIGASLVGFKKIDHIFNSSYQELKLHPYVQMEGVGDKLEVINDQSEILEQLNIHNLIKSEQNKRQKQKLSKSHSTKQLIDRKVSFNLQQNESIIKNGKLG